MVPLLESLESARKIPEEEADKEVVGRMTRNDSPVGNDVHVTTRMIRKNLHMHLQLSSEKPCGVGKADTTGEGEITRVVLYISRLLRVMD